jgi:hypothetical protein
MVPNELEYLEKPAGSADSSLAEADRCKIVWFVGFDGAYDARPAFNQSGGSHRVHSLQMGKVAVAREPLCPESIAARIADKVQGQGSAEISAGDSCLFQRTFEEIQPIERSDADRDMERARLLGNRAVRHSPRDEQEIAGPKSQLGVEGRGQPLRSPFGGRIEQAFQGQTIDRQDPQLVKPPDLLSVYLEDEDVVVVDMNRECLGIPGGKIDIDAYIRAEDGTKHLNQGRYGKPGVVQVIQDD